MERVGRPPGNIKCFAKVKGRVNQIIEEKPRMVSIRRATIAQGGNCHS